jgi:glycosyltransferase involved in cell wall biosynthesis
LELIVVDNHSSDRTREIALRYADKLLEYGPERSAQVNFGARNASGDFVYRVDSDFVLERDVVEQCIAKAVAGADAVVVHNSPDERVSWIARIRKFEVDMYKYDLTHSSARFVRADVFARLDGLNEAFTAGEDYDFQNRLNAAGCVTEFVEPEALHLGEPVRLIPHLRKYYLYGRDFREFARLNPTSVGRQLGFVRGVYIRNWRAFVRHPLKGGAFLLYHTCKFAAGLSGYIHATSATRRPAITMQFSRTVRQQASDQATGGKGQSSTHR